MDKVSVVTVCYNAVNSIEKTILSVINQKYSNIEYIIIDGNSSDGTLEIVKRYKNSISRWISEPDRGIYDAMNKGLKIATGEWIIFMNSGDSFVNENVISSFPFDKHYLAMYGNAYYVTNDGLKNRKGQCERVVYRDMPNTHQTFFVNTEEARTIKFDLQYRFAADYNMIYKMYLKYGIKFLKYVDVDICYYDVRDGLSIMYPNEVFGETIKIRRFGKRKIYDLFKYIIKKYIFKYQ